MTTISRDDIEKLMWRESGWEVDQRYVDTVLGAVDEYVAQQITEIAPPPVQEPVKPPEPQPQPEAFTRVPRRTLPLKGFMDHEGVLWVSLGVKPQPKTPTPPKSIEPELAERRTCTKCGVTRSLSQFTRDRQAPSGRRACCRTCESLYRRNRKAVIQSLVTGK